MVVLVFPAQGSALPGMGRPWRDHPSWRLAERISQAVGCDVARLLLDAGEEELRRTRDAQIAVFTSSMIALDAVSQAGLPADACAGYSLGEVGALVAAGGLSVEDAALVVGERGRLMDEAARRHPGCMATVRGIDEELADAACRQADGEVWLAGDDAPGELLIAGSAAGVAEVEQLLASSSAATRRLPVGGPFHTPLMDPARRCLREVMAGLCCHDARLPVLANLDGRPHRDGVEWPRLLSAQLANPVRWRRAMTELPAVATFVELGPGRILSRLARRNLPASRTATVAAPEDVPSALSMAAWEVPLDDADLGSGEDPDIRVRVVVSPTLGVFRPAPPPDCSANGDDLVEIGTILGWVDDQEVRSPFTGRYMGLLALPGSRIEGGEPVAWLRT
jgi:[acyl-carrier-protein] S-malonyltransferase